jgi:hypothetical protein
LQLQLRYIPLRLNPLIRPLQAKKHLSARVLNNRITISSRNRFIYYRVPKSANSSIMYNLIAHDPHQNFDLQDYTSGWAKKHAYYKPKDYGIKGARRILQDHFLFTFVRNPYDRVLSAYLDKITQPHKQRKIAKFLGKPLDTKIEFSNFIEYLMKGGLFGNIHWAPQSSFLPPNDYFHFIGYVESLEENLQELLPRLFPELSSMNFQNESKNITRASTRRDEYYTSELMQYVRKLYHTDFIRFHYDY